MSIQAAINDILNKLVKKLEKAMMPLHSQLVSNGHSLYITHNSSDLVVYTHDQYRAYIPSKFEGIDVLILDIAALTPVAGNDGGVPVQVDLDLDVYMGVDA